MKLTLSMPDPLFREAVSAAKKLGISRSKLIQTALDEFLKRRHDAEVTAAVNRSLAEHPDAVDPFVQELAMEALRRVEWKE